MKTKVLFSVYALAIMTIFAQSQSILVLEQNTGALLNGTTVNINGSSSDPLLDHYFDVTHTESINKTIGCTRYEVSVTPGTTNYFCWSVCYGAMNAGQYPIFTDVGTVTVNASDTAYGTFHVFHDPKGISGISTYRYVLFDNANPSDSSYVDIKFDVTTGIGKHTSEVSKFNIYPSNGFLKLEYELRGMDKATVLIHNSFGQKVGSLELHDFSGVVHYNSKQLSSGIYSFAVVKNSSVLAQKKAVILNAR